MMDHSSGKTAGPAVAGRAGTGRTRLPAEVHVHAIGPWRAVDVVVDVDAATGERGISQYPLVFDVTDVGRHAPFVAGAAVGKRRIGDCVRFLRIRGPAEDR